MTKLNESTIEHHAIALFRELGYAYAFGPDIGPDSNHPERADYTEVLLLERLRTAIHALNPAVPKDIRDEALRKYHNRSVDTVEVMQELIALAKALRALDQRHEALGLSKDEAAFYDVLATNDSAVQAMGDDVLKKIAMEVADTVRQNTRIDWSIREQARAHLRRMVKRVLRKHGYPHDKTEGAVNLVLEQAEGFAG